MTTTSQPGRSDPDLPGLLPAFLLAEHTDGPQKVAVVRRRSVRDWIVDVLCFLIAAGIGAISLAEEVGGDGGFTAFRVTDLVIGIVACLSLWFRRRWPVQLAVAVTAAATVVSTSGGAALVMVFTVAVHRRFPAAAAIAVANILGAAFYYWVSPPPDSSWAASTVFAALIIAVAVVWGMFVRARRQLVVSLQERARQAESEAHLRVEQAQQRERQRIAREMHDVLAHRLSLLSVHANALVHRRDAPPEDVERVSNVIRESAHQALEDLREIIGVLRASSAQPSADEPQPTLGDLPGLVDESRRAGMRVAVDDWRDDGAPLQPAVDRCAYRVVQEGLTNARKHAPGAPVSIALAGVPGDALTVNVRNGASAEVTPAESIPGSGTGLVGLNERVGLAGGTLTSGPTADGGFTLTADLPWPS